MIERPLPEAIRGSWYLLPKKGAPREVFDEDEGQLVAMRIDGTFTRYDLVGEAIKEVDDEGDYTFDGDFLILRGSSTETYRVRVEQSWYWFLEGKRKSRRLYRGLFDEGDFFELDDQAREQIARVPMRVNVETPFVDDDDAIFDLVYRGEEQRRPIGSFSVEFDAEIDALWIGLTPLATNVERSTWQKVIDKAYLQIYPGSPDHVDNVTIELLGTEDAIEFEVG